MESTFASAGVPAPSAGSTEGVAGERNIAGDPGFTPLCRVIEELQANEADNLWTEMHSRAQEADTQSTNVAKSPGCSQLNRYHDVLPFDDNRVRLLPQQLHGLPGGDHGCDYINASLVRVPRAGRVYILTQGPLLATSGHFWRMVWQQNSPGIVMLCRAVEKGSVKCHQYYPDEGQPRVDFPDDDVTVELEGIRNHGCYLERQLLLTVAGESRRLPQFHYQDWPDLGLPETPGGLLNFLMAVRRVGLLSDPNGRPPVVHCSAGVGRTGSFTLVDVCLALVSRAVLSGDLAPVDLVSELRQLRRSRMSLVETPGQLRFCYQAVAAAGRAILSAGARAADSGELRFPDRGFGSAPAAV